MGVLVELWHLANEFVENDGYFEAAPASNFTCCELRIKQSYHFHSFLYKHLQHSFVLSPFV